MAWGVREVVRASWWAGLMLLVPGCFEGTREVKDEGIVLRCDSGRTGLHRLNKRELGNTLRDLLGVDPEVAASLPDDPFKGGFDNNGSVLGMTPDIYDQTLRVIDAAVLSAFANERSRFITCEPSSTEFADPCVQEIVVGFAERAYRRPLGTDERAELQRFYEEAVATRGGFAEAVELCVLGILVSPQVLYRNIVPEVGEGIPYWLDGHEIATRLSYMLWSSTPDAELLEAAERGELEDRDQVRAQVRRMLADPRADDFIRTFTLQWLDLASLPSKGIDDQSFPGADEDLLISMQEETIAMFRHIAHNELPVMELLTADYSFVDASLAALYGIDEDVGTGGVERVRLPDERRGILTQASVLTATSYPDRTSIPQRGMWIMENLLCLPPPPPPPDDVDAEIEEGDEPTTQRERLQAHRDKPQCRICHEDMDNAGFGLEHYGPLGLWRDEDNGRDIDASGALPDGREFSSGPELVTAIAKDEAFLRCVTQNLLAYGTGRSLDRHDACVINEATAGLGRDATMVDVLTNVVLSEAFTIEGSLGEEEP